ncbi:hypothetical protein Gohar_009284 [Gossypium harknessii]|uniref:Uncharacterized protein n=1 Tax=Gossypium harknessii TaxID=34285 RepID=A0A7J9GNQ6_9ROSI|nr:hypothetical protein [Gossypium harknessii]
MAQSNILKIISNAHDHDKCTCEILRIQSTTHHEFVIGRVTKKVRHQEEQPLDEGGDLEILGDGTSKLIFFRDVVLNTGSTNNAVGDEWEVDDFDFREDDVRKEEEPLDEGGDLEILCDGTLESISFRDAILNTGLTNNAVDDEWEVDDFDFGEDDVRKGAFDGVPSIEFFDRFYALIEKSMSKTLMIKLLGRKIGYNALWNKVCAL